MTGTIPDRRQADLFRENKCTVPPSTTSRPASKFSRTVIAEIAAEREAFHREHGLYPLRQWLYPKLGPYNGFTGDERIRGWQVERWFVDNGWLVRAQHCSVTGTTVNVVTHDENYYLPWEPIFICRSAHMALHQRFTRPAWWQRIVRENARTGEEWFCHLSMEPNYDLAGTLRRKRGEDIRDLFDRAPVPEGIAIPWDAIRAMQHPLADT